jgi:DNA-3-methyladenine glycosylase
MDERLEPGFFERDPVTCARELIGCRFVWRGCVGRIVETEAYAAEGDPACHTFFRPSARAFVDRHPPGTAYVYFNYGMHWLFNILTKGPDGAGFVLFRALEPLAGLPAMRRRRGVESATALCSGPGKLTRALAIDGRAHGRHFLTRKTTGILGDAPLATRTDQRVGIRLARDLPWRFSAQGSPFVSKPHPTRGGRQ